MNEIIKYAKGVGAKAYVIQWLEGKLPNTIEQVEVEHIVDYLVSDKAPKRLERATYEQMKQKADEWTKALRKQGEHIQETEEDTETVLDFKDGFRFVKLIGKKAYDREGFLMRHCVSSYYGKDDEIYSLRDKDNMPHATISKSSQQIKGKGNGSIDPKYVHYVVDFLEHLGAEVRDGEMENLGYVNIDNIVDPNIKWDKKSLFRDKYFYKEHVEKITDKEGERYESLTLWKTFGLFSFNSKLEVKFHFNISKSIQTFLQYFKKIGKAGGNYAQLAGGDSSQLAGGNYAQLAGGDSSQLAGGDSSQLAGGDYAQLAGGYYAQLAGGDYAQLAGGDSSQLAGGDYAQLAGGDYAQLAGGYYAQLAGGDYAQLAGGNYSQLAGGYCAQLAGGDSSRLDMQGKNALSVGGHQARVRGLIGSAFALGIYDKDYNLIDIKAVYIDGKQYKEDVWYWIQEGKIAEYKEELTPDN